MYDEKKKTAYGDNIKFFGATMWHKIPTRDFHEVEFTKEKERKMKENY